MAASAFDINKYITPNIPQTSQGTFNVTDFSNTPGSATANAATTSGFTAAPQGESSSFLGDGFSTVKEGVNNFMNPYASRIEAINADTSLTPAQRSDALTGLKTEADITNANSFDGMGAINTGLSAFNAYNQYQYQNDMMGMYKEQLNDSRAARAKKNASVDANTSAFANAKVV